MVKAKTKTTRSKKRVVTPVRRYRERLIEADGVYFLKLVVVVLLSTLWVETSDTAIVAWRTPGRVPNWCYGDVNCNTINGKGPL
jgi:hypothetical protein